jgi:hypothetical protein
MEAAAMLADLRWKYAVPMRDARTGEVRTVVITLTDVERQDCLRNFAHTGGDDGPIAMGYAARRAERQMPGHYASEPIARVKVH